MGMGELFPQERIRDHRGRYCTKEQKRTDMAISENQRLRYERDKYFRAYMALAQRNASLERELIDLKNKIKGLV
jgi:hypothetical protein